MADQFKFVQAQTKQLGGAGVTAGATSFVVLDFTDPNNVDLLITDFGTIGYGTLEPGSGTQEEQISWSGVTQIGNGSALITGVKSVAFTYPYTETAGVAKSHAGGTNFVISNTAGFYDKMTAKNDDETVTGTWTFTNPKYPQMDTTTPFPTLNNQFATKGYADSLTFAGAPDATTTQKGIVQLPTQAEVDARTAVGSTLAALTPTPANLRTVLTHDYAASTTGTDAYAITLTPAVTAYTTGDIYFFGADVANTGTASLNVDGLGAKTITKADGSTLEDNDIKAGMIVEVSYDGTNMRMLSAVGNAPATQIGVQNQTYIFGTSAVGTDAYAINPTPAVTAYANGQRFVFKADVANTGPASLNVSGLGSISIVKNTVLPLVTGDIVIGQLVDVEYSSGSFQMQSQLGSVPAYAVTITSKSMADATGAGDTVWAHGLGRTPKFVSVVTGYGDANFACNTTGFYNGTTQGYAGSVSNAANPGTTLSSSTSFAAAYVGGAAASQVGVVSMDATNVTITWTKTGGPAGTAALTLMANT